MTGKELAKLVSNFVNNMSNREEKKEFVEALANDHPTLQQGTMRIVLNFVEMMATKDRFVDGRNQASVDLAKKIMEIDGNLRALPFV